MRLSRRDLFRLTALAAALPSAACGEDQALEPLTPGAGNGPVVIIGAGISGLILARELAAAGVEVVVLEARDRVGGRLVTTELGGARIDLGATWIEGSDGNPMVNLVRELGLESAADNNAEAIFREGTGWLSESAFDDAHGYVEWFEGSLRRVRRLAGGGASVAQGIEAFVADHGLGADEAAWASWMIGTSIVDDEAGDLDRLSLDWFDEDEWYGPDDRQVFGGYGQVPPLLAQGLDVRLGVRVTEVELTDAGVLVRAGEAEWVGTAAVVTVPLGVLKAGAIRFVPALPDEKLGALERLEMGTLEKVLVRFPSAFWQTVTNDFLVWTAAGGPIREFVDGTPWTGVPCLVGFLQGASGQALLAAGEEAVRAEVERLLRLAFGEAYQAPIEVRTTGWAADELSRGSYSVVPVGATPADLDRVGAPVGGRLCFAGEATDGGWHSNVHGAYLSGRREARRILDSRTG